MRQIPGCQRDELVPDGRRLWYSDEVALACWWTLCNCGVMKALSIKQPWAELIITGAKDVENRSQRTSFRGRFAVHVSLKRASYEDLGLEAIPRDLRDPVKRAWEQNSSAGRVIGTVELVDCIRVSNSIWAIDNYWHWV